MNLKEQYEKETGKRYGSLQCHVFAANDEYVEWLEAKYENLINAAREGK